VGEIPHERAHDRIDLALEVFVGEVADEGQRASASFLESLDEGRGGHRCVG
jgi:hypothetical protein